MIESLIVLAALLCCSLNVNAGTPTQSQQPGKQDIAVYYHQATIYPTLNYEYKIGKDGGIIPDGAFSIDFPVQNISEDNPRNPDMLISYLLEGNCKNGLLDGPFTVRAYCKTSESEEYHYLDACFKNGLPTGTWKAQTPRSNFEATYQNGLIIGAFTYYHAGYQESIGMDGSLNEQHQPDGSWTRPDRSEMRFNNGKLTWWSECTETNKGQNEYQLADRYFENRITAEDLEAQQGYVIFDSFNIESTLWSLSAELVNWDVFNAWNPQNNPVNKKESIYARVEINTTPSDEGMEWIKSLLANGELELYSNPNMLNKNYMFMIDFEYAKTIPHYFKSIPLISDTYLPICLTKKQGEAIAPILLERKTPQLEDGVEIFNTRMNEITDSLNTLLPDGYWAQDPKILNGMEWKGESYLDEATWSVEKIRNFIQNYCPTTIYEVKHTEISETDPNIYYAYVLLRKKKLDKLGYEDYLIKYGFSTNQEGSMALRLADSFCPEDTVRCLTEWDRFEQLCDSIRTTSRGIMQLAEKAGAGFIGTKYKETENRNFPVLTENVNQSIADAQEFIRLQDDYIRHITAVGNILSKDTHFRNAVNQYQDLEGIIRSYTTWADEQKIPDTPSLENWQKLQYITDRQNEFQTHLTRFYEKIQKKTWKIASASRGHQDIMDNFYNAMEKMSFSWDPENPHKLDEAILLCGNACDYITIYTGSILPDHERILSRTKVDENISTNYLEWYEAQDFTWKPTQANDDSIREVARIKSIERIQKDCLYYTDNYHLIIKDNPKIVTRTTKFKRTNKLYIKWFYSKIFTWTPSNESLEMIKETRHCQDILMNADETELKNIEDIIKKAKVKTMEELIDILDNIGQ